jgi:hypothetical protein
MTQPEDRQHDPLGVRFERRISRLQQEQAAEERARREAQQEALRQEIVRDPDHEEEPLQQNEPVVLRRANGANWRRRATIGDEEFQSLRDSRDEAPAELPAEAMLTPPPTPNSPSVQTEPESVRYIEDPRTATIQALRSQLEREERRRVQIQQELGRAKELIEEYTAERDSFRRLQDQAQESDNWREVSRLQTRLRWLKDQLQDSRDEVSRLEGELVSKGRTITELATELANRCQDTLRSNVASAVQGPGPVPKVRPRRPSSQKLVCRSGDGMWITSGEVVLNVPKGQGFMLR